MRKLNYNSTADIIEIRVFNYHMAKIEFVRLKVDDLKSKATFQFIGRKYGLLSADTNKQENKPAEKPVDWLGLSK